MSSVHGRDHREPGQRIRRPDAVRAGPGADQRGWQKITDVSVLQYPDGDPRSSHINDYALPGADPGDPRRPQRSRSQRLSGATYTSQGYVQSLQNALDQAGL